MMIKVTIFTVGVNVPGVSNQGYEFKLDNQWNEVK